MHQVLQKHISFDHHTSPCYDPGELQVPMKPLRPGEPVYRKLRACHLGSLGKNEFSSVCHSKCTLYIYIIYIYMICILTSKASWWHWEWWFHCETCLRNWWSSWKWCWAAQIVSNRSCKKMLRLKVFNVMFQGNFQSVSWQRQMLPVLICIQRLLQYYNPQSSCHIRSGLIKMKGEFTKQPSDMDSALDALWSGDIYPSALGMTRMGTRLWNSRIGRLSSHTPWFLDEYMVSLLLMMSFFGWLLQKHFF